jgi:2-keto-3-deoxy-L-rhamnonate aldolase RhmA
MASMGRSVWTSLRRLQDGRTEADARQLVRACYFGPLGERSLGANSGTDHNAGIPYKAAYYREATRSSGAVAIHHVQITVADACSTVRTSTVGTST